MSTAGRQTTYEWLASRTGGPFRRPAYPAAAPFPPGGGGTLYAPGFDQLSGLTLDWREASIRMKLFATGLHPFLSPSPSLWGDPI